MRDEYPNVFNNTEFIQEAESFKFQAQAFFDITVTIWIGNVSKPK